MLLNLLEPTTPVHAAINTIHNNIGYTFCMHASLPTILQARGNLLMHAFRFILDYTTDRWIWRTGMGMQMSHAQSVCRDSLYSKPLQYSNDLLLPSFIKISFILIDCILYICMHLFNDDMAH